MELAGVGRVAAIEIGVTLGARRSEPCCGLKYSSGIRRCTRRQDRVPAVATCVASSDELAGWDLLCSDQFVARHTHV